MSELSAPLLHAAHLLVRAFMSVEKELNGIQGSCLGEPLQHLSGALDESPSNLPLTELRAVVEGFKDINARGGLAGRVRLTLLEPLQAVQSLLTAIMPTPEEAMGRIVALESALRPFLFLGAGLPRDVDDRTVVQVTVPHRLTDEEVARFAALGTPVANPYSSYVLSIDGLRAEHLRRVVDTLPGVPTHPYPAPSQQAIAVETVNLDTLRPSMGLLLKLANRLNTADASTLDPEVKNWLDRLRSAGLLPARSLSPIEQAS